MITPLNHKYFNNTQWCRKDCIYNSYNVFTRMWGHLITWRNNNYMNVSIAGLLTQKLLVEKTSTIATSCSYTLTISPLEQCRLEKAILHGIQMLLLQMPHFEIPAHVKYVVKITHYNCQCMKDCSPGLLHGTASFSQGNFWCGAKIHRI